MSASVRVFEAKQAVRGFIALILALFGASGSGKTFSALEIMMGILSVVGGKAFVIDTETNRALHYAHLFDFQHVDFPAPYPSKDFLAAFNYCVSQGATVIVLDNVSHEHDGPGGLLDSHEAELDRMAGDDWKKREACKMAAWINPKADRRKLRMAISQTPVHVIMCFRAKESVRPVRNEKGKMEIEQMGFMPIAGDEFIYEAVASMLLLPNSNGLPTWKSDNLGEKLMIKLPVQFRGILDDGKPLSREHGRKLAEWARGPAPAPAPGPAEDLVPIGNLKATQGLEVLRAWWESLPVSKAKKAAAAHMPDWKALAEQTDAASAPATPPPEPEPSPEPPNGGIIHHPRSQPTMDDMREVMSETPIERPAPPAEPPAVVQQTMEERL